MAQEAHKDGAALTPEMIEAGVRVFSEWKSENYGELFEDGGLGDVADLLARLRLVLT